MERGTDPLTGRVLDSRYRVGRKIARGGMATVYEAHDLRLDRSCAVKVMHTDLGDDQDFAARFVREAHSAARLSHPNVVSVTDQGDDDGLLFIVMEHVPGRTLRDVIRDEAPVAPSRALALLEPVLMALAEAHRSGLIHRDVKPENVLIADDGRVKVADFGLARAFDANTTHTATGGLLIGTVSYLAPELIVNGKSDPRSDVYAAGVLLYELLTGHKPHEGEGAIQIAFKHVNEDIPPPSRSTDLPVPAAVDALVVRATAREREHRPADAKVFLHQLRRVRAAVDAGEADDPELTADLLPVVPAVDTDGIDYNDETLVELPAVPTQDDRESTAVIDARQVAAGHAANGPAKSAAAGSGVSSAAAAGGTTEAGGGATPVPTGVGPRDTGAVPPHPRPRPDGVRGALPRPGADPRATGASRTSRPRRSRRGLVLLVVVVLLTALAGYAGWWFAVGRYTSTPGVINLGVAAATESAEAAGLELEVAERQFSETVQAGSVISTDPAAGERIVEGGTIEAVVSRGPERYAVPKLRGKELTEAEEILEERHLVRGKVDRVFNETVEKGVVLSSTPKAGTELQRDSVVAVTVSKGREPLKIRDFTGKDADRAEERLTDIGFEVEVTEENSDDVPKGRVVSQSPTRGTGFRGDVVELVVSKGPVMVDVPDLGTMSVEEATEALEAAGLEIEVQRTEFYIALDRVVRQDPETGTSVPKGSTVVAFVV
ncbi:MAG TPA: PASTA domain-containing protein [Marmoricola sp.]|nr:PASTA domain-containing protein [Marmoricola sp.]